MCPVDGKTPKEVAEYADVFWKRGPEEIEVCCSLESLFVAVMLSEELEPNY